MYNNLTFEKETAPRRRQICKKAKTMQMENMSWAYKILNENIFSIFSKHWTPCATFPQGHQIKNRI
jgi:hypothetical protein